MSPLYYMYILYSNRSYIQNIGPVRILHVYNIHIYIYIYIYIHIYIYIYIYVCVCVCVCVFMDKNILLISRVILILT